MTKELKLASLLILSHFTLFSPHAESQQVGLSFSQHGAVAKELDFAQIKRLQPRKITVWEPHERKEITYLGVPAKHLLDLAYGKKWRNEEEVLLTCSDGYQPSIPVSYFKQFTPWIVFERVGKKNFSVSNLDQNEKKVDLGPYYLVWENVKEKHPRVRDSSIWPYQVVSIDLIRFKDRFARLIPPVKSSPTVKAGFLQYRAHCINCHKINGQGGDKARDLNYPTNITEKYSRKWLVSFLDNPSRFIPGIKMTPFNPQEPNRQSAIEEIVAYLEAMKAQKFAPGSRK